MDSVTDETPNNIGTQLSLSAREWPEQVAVAAPIGRHPDGSRRYAQLTFRELDQDSNQVAAALMHWGVKPGCRLVLMVRPGIDFISLTFALFKAGVVVVLVDPGMGKTNVLRCLEDVRPDGFVAIPLVHAIRVMQRRRFPQANFNVTVGRRWFWGGRTLAELRRRRDRDFRPVDTSANDPAAIIFTTGSTGPPKGVLYRHGNFSSQVQQIRDRYDIQPGEIDLPGFPLFALFNSAMGVTTIIPDMDPTRPANVNPELLIEAIRDWKVTQAFGSPAIWNVVGKYCESHDVTLPSVRRVLSAGLAPVPPHVLQRMKRAIAPDGEVHTPYGATEALPVASIGATEVLAETAQETRRGAGTCVGTRFSGIEWKVIPIDDQPIDEIAAIRELPQREVGELIVCGPVVTREYVTRTETNPLAKIKDGQRVWHRMGDVGYFDETGRFWFCGRKAHRVVTKECTMFTIPCEAVFNEHPDVYRSALVGIGAPGNQLPAIVVEPENMPGNADARQRLVGELYDLAQASELTRSIPKIHILLHPSLPVDIRHNAKIFREKLAVWAAKQTA